MFRNWKKKKASHFVACLQAHKAWAKSIFGGKLLKRHETAVVDELDRSGLLFLHDVSLVQQQTLELVGNCMAYSLLLPILIRLHFKAICTSTTSPHMARARFLVYRHRTWDGNTGYALSCRPVNYTCM